MEEIPLLQEMLIIILLATGVILVCHKLRIPPIVGFLITGILCGPHGFALIHELEQVQLLSSIGIILLLFLIGLEVSVDKILAAKRFFFVGGLLQLLLTGAAGFLVSKALHRPYAEAVFFGCILSLSSTAVVMRLLGERQETDTPHGRGIIAILIFQDFCAVPMMLVLPMLSGEHTEIDWMLLYNAFKGIAIVVGVATVAWLLVPHLLYQVAKTRIRELFLFTLLGICILVAWSAQQAGLSLSLGAFLAGLIISQSDFSHEAISDILPFQDLFTSFFFIAIGMLLDIEFIMQFYWMIVPIALSIIVLKSSLAMLAALACGVNFRVALLVGLCLSQIGEFSLLLAKEGYEDSLAPPFYYQLFLAVAIMTMALTPPLIQFSHEISYFISRLVARRKKDEEEEPLRQHRSGHVVIIGYGLAGRSLAHSCREASLPYVILEMNAKTVRTEQRRGEPIYFGDATHAEVLNHADITHAKVAVIAINDAVAAVRIIKAVKRLNPAIHLLVRTRYLQEVRTLYNMGADEVIPDEYGAAVELYSRVLKYFAVPHEQISALVTESLLQGYDLLTLQYTQTGGPALMPTEGVRDRWTIKTLLVDREGGLCGKTVREAGLWPQPQVMMMALKRRDSLLSPIDPDTPLEAEDLVIIVASNANGAAAQA